MFPIVFVRNVIDVFAMGYSSRSVAYLSLIAFILSRFHIMMLLSSCIKFFEHRGFLNVFFHIKSFDLEFTL